MPSTGENQDFDPTRKQGRSWENGRAVQPPRGVRSQGARSRRLRRDEAPWAQEARSGSGRVGEKNEERGLVSARGFPHITRRAAAATTLDLFPGLPDGQRRACASCPSACLRRKRGLGHAEQGSLQVVATSERRIGVGNVPVDGGAGCRRPALIGGREAINRRAEGAWEPAIGPLST